MLVVKNIVANYFRRAVEKAVDNFSKEIEDKFEGELKQNKTGKYYKDYCFFGTQSYSAFLSLQIFIIVFNVFFLLFALSDPETAIVFIVLALVLDTEFLWGKLYLGKRVGIMIYNDNYFYVMLKNKKSYMVNFDSILSIEMKTKNWSINTTSGTVEIPIPEKGLLKFVYHILNVREEIMAPHMNNKKLNYRMEYDYYHMDSMEQAEIDQIVNEFKDKCSRGNK